MVSAPLCWRHPRTRGWRGGDPPAVRRAAPLAHHMLQGTPARQTDPSPEPPRDHVQAGLAPLPLPRGRPVILPRVSLPHPFHSLLPQSQRARLSRLLLQSLVLCLLYPEDPWALSGGGSCGVFLALPGKPCSLLVHSPAPWAGPVSWLPLWQVGRISGPAWAATKAQATDQITGP